MLVASLRTLVRFNHQRLTLTVNDEKERVDTPLLFVGNNDYRIDLGAPGQRESLEDGQLCVLVMRKKTRRGLDRGKRSRPVQPRARPTTWCGSTASSGCASRAVARQLAVSLDGEVVRVAATARLSDPQAGAAGDCAVTVMEPTGRGRCSRAGNWGLPWRHRLDPALSDRDHARARCASPASRSSCSARRRAASRRQERFVGHDRRAADRGRPDRDGRRLAAPRSARPSRWRPASSPRSPACCSSLNPETHFFPTVVPIIGWLIARSLILGIASHASRRARCAAGPPSPPEWICCSPILLDRRPSISTLVVSVFGPTPRLIASFAWVLAASFVVERPDAARSRELRTDAQPSWRFRAARGA